MESDWDGFIRKMGSKRKWNTDDWKEYRDHPLYLRAVFNLIRLFFYLFPGIVGRYVKRHFARADAFHEKNIKENEESDRRYKKEMKEYFRKQDQLLKELDDDIKELDKNG